MSSPLPLSLSLPLLFLLSLLLLNHSPTHASATPSTPPQVATVRSLQAELALSTRSVLCTTRRARAITRRSAQLSRARNCRYAGLSPADYLALRAVCKNRSEARAALAICRQAHRPTGCARQERAVQKAVSACLRIGWDGSGARGRCPSIAEAKAKLAAAQGRSCPPSGRDVAVIKGELATAADAARVALGLPSPAYPTIVVEPRNENPTAVIVLLHGVRGFAVDAKVRADIAVESGLLPGVRFVVPQAPVQFVQLLNATVPSWFNLLSNTADGAQAVDEIIEAANNIDGLMDIQRLVYGIRPERVLVWGISQGGGLATTIYLRHRVGAAIVFGGFLPIANTYPAALSDASKDAPLLMFHGGKDVIVPFEIAKLSADVMKSLGRDVTFVEFPEEEHDLEGVEQQILFEGLGFAGNVLGL